MKFSTSIILFFAASVLASGVETESPADLIARDAMPAAEAELVDVEERDAEADAEAEFDDELFLEERDAEAEEVEAPAELEKRGGTSKINAGALALIKKLEGFRKNYYFIQGHKTIGYGHDCTANKDCGGIKAPISVAKATTLMKKDLKAFEKCVCGLPNAKSLNANQYGALVSFAYNSGCGGVRRYFKSTLAAKKYKTVCTKLPTTNTLKGLLKSRRKQEAALCKKATKAKSGCK